MKNPNLNIFETLSNSDFLKDTVKAGAIFKDILKFPNSLGFDKKSGGFLILHRQHAPSAFLEEIPVCLVLKIGLSCNLASRISASKKRGCAN
jgi:hypothetical protein